MNKLKGNQDKIAKAAPPFDKITGADFKKLRESKVMGGVVGKLTNKILQKIGKIDKLEKELLEDVLSDTTRVKLQKELIEEEKILKSLEKERKDLLDREPRQEGGSMDDQMMMVMNVKPMMPDEEMEDNYTQFIMEEALTEKEEEMLMSKLEQDEELAMLFDKVIDVAQEFAGSGPVEGPGSGVSDSIPARLSDGEFVFTAKATEEIGADELMRMMKDAEAAADKRQGMQTGGPMEEEETMTMQNNEPVTQEIRVVKETVDSAGRMMEDEDEISKDIKSQMMLDPNQRHVRS
jgi:putative AlgH/UPF0301 family transcriptional regulator